MKDLTGANPLAYLNNRVIIKKSFSIAKNLAYLSVTQKKPLLSEKYSSLFIHRGIDKENKLAEQTR
jgi:hypothetical protein